MQYNLFISVYLYCMPTNSEAGTIPLQQQIYKKYFYVILF